MGRFLLQTALMGVLCATAAQAVEVGVLFDRQYGKDHVFLNNNGSRTIMPGVRLNGIGFRVAVPVAAFGAGSLGIAATYHPKKEQERRLIDSIGVPYSQGERFGMEYIALGLQADWHTAINFHLGAEARREKDTYINNVGTKYTTNAIRPWVKAGLGIGAVKGPFLRFEAATAVTKIGKEDGTWEDQQKAMFPNYQVGVYTGIRF